MKKIQVSVEIREKNDIKHCLRIITRLTLVYESKPGLINLKRSNVFKYPECLHRIGFVDDVI
jgi:hypothetical protein